jgi:hypothetical protein
MQNRRNYVDFLYFSRVKKSRMSEDAKDKFERDIQNKITEISDHLSQLKTILTSTSHENENTFENKKSILAYLYKHFEKTTTSFQSIRKMRISQLLTSEETK